MALIGLGGCSDACRNTVVDRALSPDGMHAAVLFERDCGATTGFSTQVSVLGRDSRVSNGNVFIADAGHGAAATGSWGGPWAELKWIAKDHLLIRYAGQIRDLRTGARGCRYPDQLRGGCASRTSQASLSSAFTSSGTAGPDCPFVMGAAIS